MSMQKPMKMFGVHSATFVDLTTGLPLHKPLFMLGDCSVGLESEEATVKGGSSKFIQGAEVVAINSSVSLNIKEMEHDAIALMLGGTATENSTEASGWIGSMADSTSVGTATELTNMKGTTMFKTSTGIESVEALAAGDVDDIKGGVYIVKQVDDATHVDVYCVSDIEFAVKGTSGTALTFQDDATKITSAPLEITGSAVEIPYTGLSLTGGSGTIALGTSGETAMFRVRGVNDGNLVIPIGKDTIDFKKFGLFLYSARQADGTYTEIYLRKVHAAGFPYQLPEGNYGTSDITFGVERDGAMGLGEIRYVKGRHFDL